ncbi:nucleotide sugar dehydrogenase [Desulfosediminicola sp.]|uniref:nucleotide sugar dehydrogenase n=1 Tax=Desulfosediminicola sp. TaxID=2886825 RepID=UPI003AF20108
MITLKEARLCVVGLGYVGLPLAVEFGYKYPTIGFDLNRARIEELQSGKDLTLEVPQDQLMAAEFLSYTDRVEKLTKCNIFIVAVPTPIDDAKQPDLKPLLKATETVAGCLKRGDIVIYESTVYPGATEEECVPLLEEISGLTYNRDFCCGYSPERINPGDHEHRLPTIVKVTSGSTPEAAELIDKLYSSIIDAGTFKASSIKVAEAAKVIENTQRDVNIGLINELSLIFNKLGLNTMEVLQAAGTKWNFLPFRPGLVGGHCIGVDPYYLTYKAKKVGYRPRMILAGRRTNDAMGHHIAARIVKMLLQRKIDTINCRVLIMGLTFKENCPDLRNTRVTDIIDELREYGIGVDVHDPWVDREQALKEYGIELVDTLVPHSYDTVILAVGHKQFAQMSRDDLQSLRKEERSIIFDVKSLYPRDWVDDSL